MKIGMLIFMFSAGIEFFDDRYMGELWFDLPDFLVQGLWNDISFSGGFLVYRK